MCTKELTVFNTNYKIKKPAFEEGAFVVLKRKYTPSDPFYLKNPHLKEGVSCLVEECRLYLYPNEFDEATNEWSKITDGKECCYISIFTPKADYDNDSAYVEAVDLKPFEF